MGKGILLLTAQPLSQCAPRSSLSGLRVLPLNPSCSALPCLVLSASSCLALFFKLHPSAMACALFSQLPAPSSGRNSMGGSLGAWQAPDHLHTSNREEERMARQEILVENFHISNNPALQNLSSQSVHPQFSTMAPERKKLECSNQKITT